MSGVTHVVVGAKKDDKEREVVDERAEFSPPKIAIRKRTPAVESIPPKKNEPS